MQELVVAKKMMISTRTNSNSTDHINTSKENNNNNKEGDQDQDQDQDQDVALPGFRFHPTDEELVGFYLRRKVEKKPISIELIKQIDIYKYDPWDLPKVGNVGDKEWYFFCIRGRKYRNSVRPNRVTGSGFWKATGIDKPIYSAKEPHGCVGLKKSLVYYRGSAGKGTKTDWMMHEFRLPPNPKSSHDSNFANHSKPLNNNNNNNNNIVNAADLEAEVWTLCRIFKRTPSYKKYNNMIPTDHTIDNNVKEISTTPTKSQSVSSISTHVDDSNSKTCSLETDYLDPYHVSMEKHSHHRHNHDHHHHRHNDMQLFLQCNKRPKSVKSDDHDREMMSTITHGSWFTLGQYYRNNPVPQLVPPHQHQAPIMLPGSNYPIFNVNPNTEDQGFFTNESWDELSPVVQFAVDRHDQS